MKNLLLLIILLFLAENSYSQWTYVSERPTNGIKNNWYYEAAVIDTVIYVCADSKLAGYGPNSWNGFGWYPISNTGIPYYPFTGQYYSAGGLTPSKVFVGTGNGLYVTTNRGDNWTKVAFGQDTICMIKNIKILSGKIYISTCNGIYTSSNNGIFWTRLNDGIVGQSYPELIHISDTLFVGISTYPQQYIYRSTNMGVNWTATAFNLPLPGDVYFGPSVFYKNKVYLSQSRRSSSLGAALYRTGNFGQTWDSVSLIQMTKSGINSFLSYGNFLFITTDSGIYSSANEGYNWTDVSGNLRDSLGVTTLFKYKNDFYAAHRTKGIFKRPISQLVSVSDPVAEIPAVFSISQNYPNPFNPLTEITYTLPANSFVSIKIFDLLGREIAVLLSERKEAGEYNVRFDGSGHSSGVYFYKFEAGDFTDMKKMVLIK